MIQQGLNIAVHVCFIIWLLALSVQIFIIQYRIDKEKENKND